jgi:hypothetical protein
MTQQLKRQFLLASAGLFLLISWLPCAGRADVVMTTGAVVDSGAVPTNLRDNAVGSNTTIFLFLERAGVVLPSAVTLNAQGAGSFGVPAGPFTLAAGTVVDSYILHYDRVSGGGSATGSVTFGAPILGAIGTMAALQASDPVVGGPVTTYATFALRPFWDSGAGDSMTISTNLRTLTFTSRNDAGAMDELRILVSPVAVPEPSTFVSAIVGALGVLIPLSWRARWG